MCHKSRALCLSFDGQRTRLTLCKQKDEKGTSALPAETSNALFHIFI